MIRINSCIFFWMQSLDFKSRSDLNHHLIVQSSSLDNDIFCLEASFFTIFFNKENWKGIAHHLLTINNNLLHTTTQKDIIYFFTKWLRFKKDKKNIHLKSKKLRPKLLTLLFHWEVMSRTSGLANFSLRYPRISTAMDNYQIYTSYICMKGMKVFES